jgi:two-component system NtrC family response regulator
MNRCGFEAQRPQRRLFTPAAMIVLSPASECHHGAAVAEAGVVGDSTAMRTLASLIRRVGPANSTVLVEGESGTGKEVVAASLHHHSGRAGPFVAINCGSMSADLLDSELFGHARGAFTGAGTDREGLFRHAGGGTLFLDEIGELPLFLQAKLLRVLETLMIRPVGTEHELPVDVRIVAATNRPMTELVAAGLFRSDLFFRLNVVSLRVPPLRERPEDIGPLAEFFIEHFSRQLGLPAVSLDRLGLLRLHSHIWPGNVRELRNLIERATLLGRSPAACLRLQTLDSAVLQQRGTSGYPPDMPLVEVRRKHMAQVLRACAGNKSEAARRMGISRKTLERKVREEGL